MAQVDDQQIDESIAVNVANRPVHRTGRMPLIIDDDSGRLCNVLISTITAILEQEVLLVVVALKQVQINIVVEIKDGQAHTFRLRKIHPHFLGNIRERTILVLPVKQ